MRLLLIINILVDWQQFPYFYMMILNFLSMFLFIFFFLYNESINEK